MRHVAKLVPLDLEDVDGNAMMLMASFRKAARRSGTPQEEVEAVISDCKSGDYDHLLQVLMDNTHA